jgi:hypothetical protein
VGIHDIPTLSATSRKHQSDSAASASEFPPSWIACSTDDLLATKPQLYDILVNLSPPSSVAYPVSELPRQYPKIHPASSIQPGSIVPTSYPLLATQRDLRRYRNLKSDLATFSAAKSPLSERAGTAAKDDDEADVGVGSDNVSITSSKSSQSSLVSTEGVVEPTPWAQIAYNSCIWWASAGENRTGFGGGEDEEDEDGQDRALLMAAEPAQHDGSGSVLVDGPNSGPDVWGSGGTGMPCREMAIVGYFHRLTGLIFTTISDAISRVDGERVRRGECYGGTEGLPDRDAQLGDHDDDGDDDVDEGNAEEGDEESIDGADETAALLPSEADDPGPNQGADEAALVVVIASSDMQQMGLDAWSQADREFVRDLVQLWWGRSVVVDVRRIECCGVRVL